MRKNILCLLLTILCFFLASPKLTGAQDPVDNQRLEKKIKQLANNIETLKADVHKNIKQDETFSKAIDGLKVILERIDRSVELNISTITEVSKKSISAITKVSEASISTHDSSLTKITWMIGIASILVTIIAGGLAFFGIKEAQDVHKIKKGLVGELNKIKEDCESELNKIKEDSNTISQTRKDLEANSILSAIKEYVNIFGLYNEVLLKVKDLLALDPSDKTKARAYGWKGYVLKRLGRHEEAFIAAEVASGLDPDNPSLSYNCACYAALTHNKDEALDYLRRTFEIIDEWKEFAKKELKGEDNDFENIQTDTEFLELLGINA